MRLFKNLKSGLPEFFLILAMTSTLILMVFLNDIVTNIGFRELQNNLVNLNTENSNRDFIGMVAKYKLQKKLYQNQINENDYNLKEVKTNYITANNSNSLKIKTNETIKYKKLVIPALFLINSIRFLTGGNKIELSTKDSANQYLDIAYYYERNKLYKKALELYAKAAIVIPITNVKLPIIQLHQGYCYSIIGDYENAKKRYQQIIKDDRNKKVTETARILLNFINEFEEEIKKIKSSKSDSIEKSEKLYKLMAYKDSIELLEKSEPKSKKELEKIQYYKARSHEELGDTKKSIELYQDIITQNPKSEYSKLSNKRLLTISSTSDDNKDLKKLADKNNEKVKDKEYSEYSDTLDRLKNENAMTSPEKILKNDSADKKLSEDVLEENNDQDNETKDFIDKIVNMAVKENRSFSIKNTKFYENEIKKLEGKNAALIKENRKIENKIKEMQNRGKKYPDNRSETVTNVDQFGRIVSKFTYKVDGAGVKYLDSYSIYYYTDNKRLYKISDYNKNNHLVSYYMIKYDEEGKQSEIRKYDASGNLIYVE